MKIAFVSDIHEDIVNLQKAFQKIEDLKCDKIICLGDISGDSTHHIKFFQRRNASDCLRMIQDNCETIILGNHDLNAVQKIPQNIKGFDYPKDWYYLDYPTKRSLAGDKLWLYEENELNPMYSKEDIEFLRTKSEREAFSCDHRQILLSHYAFPNLTGSLQGFYFDVVEFKDHFQFMDKHNYLYSFIGHEHANGLFVVKENGIIDKGFSDYFLTDTPSIIIVPAIVAGKKRSGILTFDTESYRIQAIKI
jgi:predicted phosphodiesterase